MSWAFEIPWHHNQQVRERHFLKRESSRRRARTVLHWTILQNEWNRMQKNERLYTKSALNVEKRELRRAAIMENIFTC